MRAPRNSRGCEPARSGPVRRRGRAIIRIATSFAPCATLIFSHPQLSCSGARSHHHGGLGIYELRYDTCELLSFFLEELYDFWRICLLGTRSFRWTNYLGIFERTTGARKSCCDESGRSKQLYFWLDQRQPNLSALPNEKCGARQEGVQSCNLNGQGRRHTESRHQEHRNHRRHTTSLRSMQFNVGYLVTIPFS